jgi:DivIVA domain-containing protein
MSATELDLPLLISAEQIRRREFVTIRRGYDPDQVRRYLDQLAEQVDLMASMLRDSRLQADAAARSTAAPRMDPYERLANRVASVIREADESAERLLAEGRRDAERMMTEARTDADRIRTDAQAMAEEARSDAERSLRDARMQADRTMSELATRRDTLVGELAQMQERLLGVARDLEATLDMPEPAPTTGAWPGQPPAVAEADEDEAGRLEVVDLRAAPTVPAPEPSTSTPSAPLFELDPPTVDALLDPSSAGLWEGTGAIQIEVPDIPPLDLDWGDLDEDDEPEAEGPEAERPRAESD